MKNSADEMAEKYSGAVSATKDGVEISLQSAFRIACGEFLDANKLDGMIEFMLETGAANMRHVEMPGIVFRSEIAKTNGEET